MQFVIFNIFFNYIFHILKCIINRIELISSNISMFSNIGIIEKIMHILVLPIFILNGFYFDYYIKSKNIGILSTFFILLFIPDLNIQADTALSNIY